MKAEIEVIEELLTGLRRIENPSPYVRVAIGNLSVASTNLGQEITRVATEADRLTAQANELLKQAAAARQTAGSDAAPAPKAAATPSPVRE